MTRKRKQLSLNEQVSRVMIKVETARLLLRTYEKQDLEALYLLWNDAEVMKYVRPGWTPSREDVEIYFERIKNRWVENGFSHFAVTLKSESKLIGYCGFQNLENSSEIELLYGLAKQYWGRGYITEAAYACLRFAYENTDLDRIVALAYPLNKASSRVMEKVGMTLEKMVIEKNDELVLYAIARDGFQHNVVGDSLKAD
jgi:RimJ/RimL family protein N-acetyltransferase